MKRGFNWIIKSADELHNYFQINYIVMYTNISNEILFKIYQKSLIRTFHTSFLYYKMTFVNSQHKFKGWFVLKNLGWNTLFKHFWCAKKSDSDLVWRIQSESKISILYL